MIEKKEIAAEEISDAELEGGIFIPVSGIECVH